MHSALKLWICDLDYRVLFLAFRGFALRGFERDFVRLIAFNRAAISKTVEQPLFAKIIGIAEALTDRDKADVNSACILCFSFARCQCPIPKRRFQLGNRPGTISVRLCVVLCVCGDSGLAGIWKKAADCVRVHTALQTVACFPL